MNRKLEVNDYVGFRRENSDKTEYGIIQRYNRTKKMYEIALCSREDNIFLPKSELTYMPRKLISADDLKKLIRYEITYADFSSDIIPAENYSFEDYEIEYSFDDMVTMIRNISAAGPDKNEFKSWLFMAFSDEMDYCCSEDCDAGSRTTDKSFAEWNSPVNEYDMAAKIFNIFWEISIENIWTDHDNDLRAEIDINYILIDIENFRNNQSIKSHLWTTDGKRRVCDLVRRERIPADLTDDEKNEIRKIVTDMASAGDKDALIALGYACYGGDNPVFECDWITSRDCFLKLCSMDDADNVDKCYFANTLGYIFYYGRCNDGVPEYEKALKYFTMGSNGGIYESMYKLADMYIHGYGTEINKRAAECLIRTVYDDTYKQILKGEFDCKFADAALRMGNMCRDNIIYGDEYYYYTLADYAIRKRAAFNHYGDSKVFMGIQKELARIRERFPIYTCGTLTDSHLPDIACRLIYEYSCKITVSPVKSGMSIHISRLPRRRNAQVEKVFDCHPLNAYCRLVDSVTVKAIKAECEISDRVTFIADEISEEWDYKTNATTIVFYHHGEKVFSLNAERFSYKLQKKTKQELTEQTFASVTFSTGGRTYDYICNIPDVKVGDKVVVFANDEEKVVEVQRIFKMQMGDMPLELERYKEILRKV